MAEIVIYNVTDKEWVECTTTGLTTTFNGFGSDANFRGIFDAGDNTHIWILDWITGYGTSAGNWRQSQLKMIKMAIDLSAKTATYVETVYLDIGPVTTGLSQTNCIQDGDTIYGVASHYSSYTAPSTYENGTHYILWSWNVETAPATITVIKDWDRTADGITANGGNTLVRHESVNYLLDAGFGWNSTTSVTLISDSEMTLQDEIIPISGSNGSIIFGLDTDSGLVHIDSGQWTSWISARWDPGANGYTTYQNGSYLATIGTGFPGDLKEHYYCDGDPLIVVEAPRAVYV